MKKVLIITYYWPPSAGAGVFRWLKFTKYLRDFGWEPIIYTPENPESPGTDSSLTADIPKDVLVLKRRIWEPYTLYKRLSGKKKDAKIQTGFLNEDAPPGMVDKLSAWLRGNLFIPDARKYWIKPSIRFLSNWLNNNHVDVIVSTGPPHSMHMIALGLKETFDTPWMADFRDPWTQIDFYDKLKLTTWADKKHKRREKKVLKHADAIVTVSKTWALSLENLANRSIQVVTNGYDPDDFKSLPKYVTGDFTITHLGAMNSDRNPEFFWKSLSVLLKEQPLLRDKLKILMIGKTDYSVRQSLRQHDLLQYTTFISYLGHKEALKKAALSAVLLLPLNNTFNVKGIIPGKLYEYLALKRPIFCTGPASGDTAKILHETQSGVCIDFEDFSNCRNNLLAYFEKHQNGKLFSETKDIAQYSRKTLTGSITELMNSIS